MSMLWPLLGLLAFTDECVALFPNDLGDGKDKRGNIVVLLILKTAVEKKKQQWKMFFFPPSCSTNPGVANSHWQAASCQVPHKRRGLCRMWGGLTEALLGPDFKSIPLKNAHCSSIKILSPEVFIEFINRPYNSTEALTWFTNVKLM